MNLTKEQEKQLIEYALSHLLNGIASPVRSHIKKPKGSRTKQKWSASQHKKFSKTMKAKWQERKTRESQ